MKKLKEEIFFMDMDIAESLGNITNDYYPLVEELKMKGIVENNIEVLKKYEPFILYFASNPFKREGLSFSTEREYIETVEYCKKLIPHIPVEES